MLEAIPIIFFITIVLFQNVNAHMVLLPPLPVLIFQRSVLGIEFNMYSDGFVNS